MFRFKMTELSVIGLLELQSTVCSNYEISTIYYDEENSRLYIGTYYGCMFVYYVMSEYVHV